MAGLALIHKVHALETECAKLKKQRDALLNALLLVQVGLKNGNVKSKPLIAFNENSTNIEVESLEEIVDAAIAKARK